MTTPPPEQDYLVGTVFDGRYEVLDKIGDGGMGSVYRARQVAMDRLVALKVILPDMQTDDIAVKRFFREMKTTSRITHPNTVRVYDFGKTEGGTLFLTMELLSGHSLADRIDRGPLPLSEALPIATGILKGLSAAHAEQIVHRDLKPDNIMLCEVYGEPDQVKVLDFGIATFAPTSPDAPSARVTASGILVGTPSYLSPEQISGDEVGTSSDLYAIGVLLYQMTTGRLPFHDTERPMRVLHLHMTEMPPPPSQVAAQAIPAWLDELILRLMAKYPEDRPGSADDVLEIIEGALAEAATVEAPATVTAPTSVWWAVAASGVVFGLVGLLVGWLVL